MTTGVDQEWPEGVIARFVTVGGAFVDVEELPNGTAWRCLGCGATGVHSAFRTRPDANQHATTCRSLPRRPRSTQPR
jgi:hypothetical protein